MDGDFDGDAVARHYGLDDATDGMPDESPALLGDRLTDVREDQKP